MKKSIKFLLTIIILLFVSRNEIYAVNTENIYGISKVNKVIKNVENARYILIENERVRVGSIEGNNIIILDTEGNIFDVEKSDIEIVKQNKNFNNLLEENTVNRNSVINSAFYKENIPYVYGAVGPNSFDCSGFTYQIFKNELGIDINRVSREQYNNGIEISRENLLPGDLVFFTSGGSSIGHVGIYIGDGNMIHASSGANKVVVSSLSSTWYNTRYVGARRLIY